MQYTKPNWTEIFDDSRPLTEEILEELGFELIADKQLGNPHYDMKIGDITLYASEDTIRWYVHIGIDGKIWKTVGSVKLLTEALKGEIK